MDAAEPKPCPFCKRSENKKTLENTFCYATWDRHPVSEGHMLLVPFRHVKDYFSATAEEKAALWTLLDEAKVLIDERHRPDGYNIGVNVGPAAGQSVFHLHIHVIPRYSGDVDNPRGGVRSVIPDKRFYQQVDHAGRRTDGTGLAVDGRRLGARLAVSVVGLLVGGLLWRLGALPSST